MSAIVCVEVAQIAVLGTQTERRATCASRTSTFSAGREQNMHPDSGQVLDVGLSHPAKSV
jgi:hypothetical protein